MQCSLIADQVLWTGASLFLWGLASRANCSTGLVPVGVEDRAIKEDSLAVSACCVRDICAPYSEGAANRQLGVVRPPPPPSGFVRLHADAEAFRKSWVEKHTASGEEKIVFAGDMQQQMLAELAKLGYDYHDGILPSAA